LTASRREEVDLNVVTPGVTRDLGVVASVVRLEFEDLEFRGDLAYAEIGDAHENGHIVDQVCHGEIVDVRERVGTRKVLPCID